MMASHQPEKRLQPTLPDLPTDKDYEGAVAALLQASGYYTERNLRFVENGEEIIETDIILTDYGAGRLPRSLLAEAKSGAWGYGDIFKLRGQMDYLGIRSALLFYKQSKRHGDTAQRVASRLGVSLVEVTKPHTDHNSMGTVGPPLRAEAWSVCLWSFAFWVERRLRDRLKQWKNSDRRRTCFRYLEERFDNMTSGVFLESTPEGRAIRLYNEYGQCPHLSAAVAGELAGNTFRKDLREIPTKQFRATFYEHEYNAVQIACFFEHLARQAIIKQAVDIALSSRDQPISRFALRGLPDSFVRTTMRLRNQPHVHLYPNLWQWFNWIMGGFILKEYINEDLELLSKCTGVPKKEIPAALALYDQMFPLQAGKWLMSARKGWQACQMRFFPVPFTGLGVHTRVVCYTKSHQFSDLRITDELTAKRLYSCLDLTRRVLTS